MRVDTAKAGAGRAALLAAALLAVAAAGCKGKRPSSAEEAEFHGAKDEKVAAPRGDSQRARASRPPRQAEKKAMNAPAAPPASEPAAGARTFKLEAAAADALDDATAQASREGGAAPGAAAPARTRSWFPETFLFEPAVLTDPEGHASVTVRVPDRLTTWRILALAHTREGTQAGTEASFLGTLPAYVDPVLPASLYAGDEVRLPVQIVNTTAQPLRRALRIEASGAATLVRETAVSLGPSSNRIEAVTLSARHPGRIVFRALLQGADAVERAVPVLPSGRPVTARAGGTLAAPRTVSFETPGDALPEGGSVRLLAFPGALALLRAELGTAGGRGGPAEDAYALLLAGRAPELMRSLGGEADPKALRALAIVAGQRVIRAGRAPDFALASLLAEAALSHPDNPVLSRLGARLAETVARGQRPDGTFSGETGWPLQRLLVATAGGVHAALADQTTAEARQRGERARLLASGAVERNLGRIEDGYTAAAILASGAVEGGVAERLRKTVRDQLRTLPDGSRALTLPPEVARADGGAPSDVEATALAVLALRGDEAAKAILPDLGARLLAAYEPAGGWGDGQTNLVALRAVLALFSAPLPARVQVRLRLDERILAEGVLEGDRLRQVLPLDAPLPGAPGKHAFRVEADPPVPGLGFTLAWVHYAPWPARAPQGGIELEVTAPRGARVGRPAEVAIVASAPAGLPVTIHCAFPAGVEPDRARLDALLRDGTVAAYRLEAGGVRLDVSARQPGQVFEARITVVPTLAGMLTSGPSSIGTSGAEAAFVAPPARWAIAER